MLTLEERERIAYITNSPDHPLIVLAIDADEDVRAELTDAEQALKEEEQRSSVLSGQVEDIEIKVGDLEEKLDHAENRVEELESQIHEAGVDLV